MIVGERDGRNQGSMLDWIKFNATDKRGGHKNGQKQNDLTYILSSTLTAPQAACAVLGQDIAGPIGLQAGP